MDAELKAKWVAALREPNRKQITGFLERRDHDGTLVGQCCLGVLCEVAGLKGKIRGGGIVSYDENTRVVPFPLCEQVFGPNDHAKIHELTSMNDRTFPFSYIAD